MQLRNSLILFSTFFAFSLQTEAANIIPRNNPPAPQQTQQRTVAQDVRDLANLKADFAGLQEENQKLNLRLENLELENKQLEAKLNKILDLVSTMNEQLAANDRNIQEQIDSIRQAMDSERKQRQSEMQNMADNVARQISSTSSGKKSNRPAPSSKYIEFTVEPGDTLSSIGKGFGIPWETIKEFNELNSDIIRPGQVLKIPQN